jgi:uncharacterized protein YggE
MRPFLTVLLFAVLAAPAAAQTTPVDTTPTIAADGLGTATLTPDVADFQAGVERVAPTSSGARKAANRRMAAVFRALKAGGIANADIRTVGLSVSRERVKKRIRYRAQQSVVVHVRTVANLAALLDAVASAGADAVGEPEFGFADSSAGRLLATRAALADARRRADDAAAVVGMRITGVRTVSLDPDAQVYEGESDSAMSGGGAEKAPATRVEPGTQDFTERVRVIYTAAPLT